MTLIWAKHCVLTRSAVVLAAHGDNPAIIDPKNATFQITDTKLYVPIITLTKANDKKLLEQLKSGFERTVKWNKYKSKMAVQSNDNRLNFLTGPTFIKVNRLFVLSFEKTRGENNTAKGHRDSLSHYYVPNVEMKDFNVLIDEKSFFDLPVKNEEEA